jgi:orotate phosphoribosyltransferase
MQVCTIASLKDLRDYLATTADPAQQVHEAAIKAYRDRYGV